MPIFNDWVKEWNRWTNPFVGIGITQYEPISKSQLKALAYEAKIEGIENISIETSVRDKRTKTGFRTVFKNLETGRFAKNPYRENLE